MGKGKLAKFADMETYGNVFQYPFFTYEAHPFTMQGHWHEQRGFSCSRFNGCKGSY